MPIQLVSLVAIGIVVAARAESETAANLYANNCAAGHGEQVGGAQGLPLVRTDGQLASEDQELARIITESRSTSHDLQRVAQVPRVQV